MRNQRPVRQGDQGPLTSADNYPPQLSIDSCVDPDKEDWRRSNPFDKHYDRNPNQVDLSTDPYHRNPNQVDLSTDPYNRNLNRGYRDTPYQRNPSDGYVNNTDNNSYRRNPSDRNLDRINNQPYKGDSAGNICRDPNDRKNFYAHQNDAYSCSAFSMAMMASDWNTGRPPSNAESSQWKQIAGTIGQGYRGSLNQVASNLKQGIPELHTKVYNYGMGKVGTQAMQDLNQELAQGHTAVAKVINPHTGNAHYIYIAGRSAAGGYVLGDPDRKNSHQEPISGDRLMRMMSRRDGFVAGWKDAPSAAARSQGSAANRYAMAHGGDRQTYA